MSISKVSQYSVNLLKVLQGEQYINNVFIFLIISFIADIW